jgi:hypothetical protein
MCFGAMVMAMAVPPMPAAAADAHACAADALLAGPPSRPGADQQKLG